MNDNYKNQDSDEENDKTLFSKKFFSKHGWDFILM
jgi:hypothetical protein